jgi:hypothetical protein
MGHAQRQAGACPGRTSGFVAPASCRHPPTGGSQGLLGESWDYPNVRAASRPCLFSPSCANIGSEARSLRSGCPCGGSLIERLMSRRFSARQKLIPLNLTNYQLPLFRMHPPRKGYQQDALFAGNKVEFSPLYKVHRERAIFLVTFRPSRFSTPKQPQTKSRGICTCKTKELSILK